MTHYLNFYFLDLSVCVAYYRADFLPALLRRLNGAATSKRASFTCKGDNS